MFTPRRNERGMIGWVLLSILILLTLTIGAIAVDGSRLNHAHHELQLATDAAALAGAIDLFRDPNNVIDHALATAAANTTNGNPVSTATPDTTVNVEILGNPPLQSVRVTATMRMRNLLAGIVARNFDTVSASSTAGGPGPIWRVPENDTFPLAVSLDTAVGGSTPLKDMKIGDTWQIFIGSQKVKNGAFTSFTKNAANANYIRDCIDQSLGLKDPVPGFIPSIAVGDSINLNNGIIGQKKLADETYLPALTAEEFFILPVITGDPAMNQDRPVIGFIAVKFLNVETNGKGGIVETLTVKLVSAVTRGTGGQGEDPPPGVNPQDPDMIRLAVQTVHLIR